MTETLNPMVAATGSYVFTSGDYDAARNEIVLDLNKEVYRLLHETIKKTLQAEHKLPEFVVMQSPTGKTVTFYFPFTQGFDVVYTSKYCDLRLKITF